MTPAHANKYPGGKMGTAGHVRYRYYVSCAIPQGRKHKCGSVPRATAHEIEGLVVAALRARLDRRNSKFGSEISSSDSPALDSPMAGAETEQLSDAALIAHHLDCVVVGARTLELILKPDVEGEQPPEPIAIPWSRPVHTRKRAIIIPEDSTQTGVHPIRAEARARLVAAIVRARQWVTELTSDPQVTTTTIAAREKLSERSLRMTLPLAFLSPAIVKAAIGGTLPFGTGVMALAELPTDWGQQARAVAGIGRADPRRCAS